MCALLFFRMCTTRNGRPSSERLTMSVMSNFAWFMCSFNVSSGFAWSIVVVLSVTSLSVNFQSSSSSASRVKITFSLTLLTVFDLGTNTAVPMACRDTWSAVPWLGRSWMLLPCNRISKKQWCKFVSHHYNFRTIAKKEQRKRKPPLETRILEITSICFSHYRTCTTAAKARKTKMTLNRYVLNILRFSKLRF